MALHHISQLTGVVEVSGPLLNSNSLRDRYLHAVDIFAVPQRLEQKVSKTEYKDILNGFFAQVMVYAIDLFFVENLFQLSV